MPEKLFTGFLQVSLTTGILILLLKLLSMLFRKNIAAKWNYWIWLILAVRLVLPFHIALPVSPVELRMPNLEWSTIVKETPAQPTPNATVTANPAIAAEPQQKITPLDDKQASVPVMKVTMIFWLLGCSGLLAYQFVGYQAFRKKALRWSTAPANPQITVALQNAATELGVHQEVAIYISEGIASPLMIGFVQPKLLLPSEDYSQTDLSFILRHELTHCKRNDLWYKLLLVFATAVHWFNPLVWLMARDANADLEMSCDDEVLRGIGLDGRRAYSETILAAIGQQKIRQTVLTTSFNGGKSALHNRFLNILTRKRKKRSALVLLTAVLIFGVLGTLLGCSVEEAKSPDADPPTEAVSVQGTGPFVGYVKDTEKDTFEVYTAKNGTYIMSLPMSLFDDFPANHWEQGWMDVSVYCGILDKFTWAVVSTGPSAGTGNANVCTSSDSGKTWWVGDRSAMYSGTVTGAGFASAKVGFMSYRYFVDQGPEISRTLDGGKTWNRMAVEIPEYLKEYRMTPLVPTFTGDSGSYPIELYDSDGKSSLAYLTTEDGGMTWQWGNGSGLDEAVSAALLKDNQTHYLSGECAGEGHILLGGDTASGVTTAYALTMYGEYGFEDGNFVKVSGSGMIPAVFTFTNAKEGLVCTKIEYAEDGSEYANSIKRLFPSEYQEKVLQPSDSDLKELTSQERSYAASYLKKIGRDAVIGDYGDFQHPLLTDAGVSTEVSNITCGSQYSDYPMWIGNREAIENGVRYVYETSYHKESHEIDFTKYEYDTKKTIQILRLDSLTGQKLK